MAEPANDSLLNGRQCAESIGISYTAFSKWKVAPAETGRGRERLYRLSDVLVVYRARCRRELERELRPQIRAEIEAEALGVDADSLHPEKVRRKLDSERVRLTQAQADAQEMKNEVARHELAPFGFITFVLGRLANDLAGVIDGLPVELMRKLTLTPQEVEKVRSVAALAADEIVNLGDEKYLGEALDDFIAETDQ